MSLRSVKARAWKATGTSSTWIATLGSTPMEKAKVPIPRIETEEFTGCSAGRTTRDGASLPRSVNSCTPAAASLAPDTTCTAWGTSWTFSARFWAVTMTSSTWTVPAAAAAAWAVVAVPTLARPTITQVDNDVFENSARIMTRPSPVIPKRFNRLFKPVVPYW